MVNNHVFEEQLRKLISETQDELNQIDAQRKVLEDRRAEILEELRSFEISLRGYLKRAGKEGLEEAPLDWDRLFKRCKTHKDKLLMIAKKNDGELKFNAAVDILYNGKYIKSKARENAYVQLYQIVANMVDKGLLEKTGRGVYKLAR